jgi:hypothetical protein
MGLSFRILGPYARMDNAESEAWQNADATARYRALIEAVLHSEPCWRHIRDQERCCLSEKSNADFAANMTITSSRH